MKRLLLISTHPQQCTGYAKVVYNILKHKPNDLEIIVYGFHYLGKNIRNIDFPNVIIHNVQNDFGINEIKDFTMLCKPDRILIYNDSYVTSAFIMQLKDLNIPIDIYLDVVYKYIKSEQKSIINNYTSIIYTFTEHWKNELSKEMKNKNIQVMKHGIDIPIINNAKSLLNLENDSFLFLNLNRNQPRKRWDVCIKAFKIFLSFDSNIKAKLVIGCISNDAWNLNEILENEQIDIENNILFINDAQRNDDSIIHLLYNACDVGLNCADGEGFGLCNYEHGSIGKPQIVSNVGGLKELPNAFHINPKWEYYVDSQRDAIGGLAEVIDPNDMAEVMYNIYTNYKETEKFKINWNESITVLTNNI